MQGNLLDLQVSTLLDKFGAGNHKPGSGSAAALQGMLSAKLILTVIDLTKDREDYKDKFNDLQKIKDDIDQEIYPSLKILIQKDSEEFDKVIRLRNSRNQEKDLPRKSQLAIEALKELKTATDIPIEIGKLCIRLIEHAVFVFDNGFQSARGDSGVAMNFAVSSVAGCLSIIDLNLITFINVEWIDRARAEVNLLRLAHARLAPETISRQESLKAEAEQINAFHSKINALRSKTGRVSTLSNSEIEVLVTGVQNVIWECRESVWKKDVPERPLKMLDPEVTLKKLGYQYKHQQSLGFHDTLLDRFEIAGLIDTKNMFVSISGKFPLETQNFTMAHELGHALLHPGQLLHRDRPIDGSEFGMLRDRQEIQADKFAAYFLMPRKLVKEAFQTFFLTDKFVINEVTAIGMGIQISEFRKKCKDLRDLSKMLASTEYYDNRPFQSLSKWFGVSVEAMAIRLEELQLLNL